MMHKLHATAVTIYLAVGVFVLVGIMLSGSFQALEQVWQEGSLSLSIYVIIGVGYLLLRVIFTWIIEPIYNFARPLFRR